MTKPECDDSTDVEITETLSETTVCLASQEQIEALMLKLTKLVDECVKRRNKLLVDLGCTLEKAKARYASGGSLSALISMRKVQKLRVEVAHLSSTRCKLMAIFVKVQVELEQAREFGDDDDLVLVDVELEDYMAAIEDAQEDCSPKMTASMLKTDEDLFQEVHDLVSRSSSK